MLSLAKYSCNRSDYETEIITHVFVPVICRYRGWLCPANNLQGTAYRRRVGCVLTNNVYYNLQGVRVAQPTKGVYINNGKKVVVK